MDNFGPFCWILRLEHAWELGIVLLSGGLKARGFNHLTLDPPC